MENPFLKEYKSDRTDAILVKEAQAGDKIALEELILKHQPYIYNIAWKMVRNDQDAQDLTQEATIKVITKLSQFEGRSAFRTWLYRIVANHFLMGKRKKGESIVDSFEAMGRGLDSVPDIPLTPLEQKENEAVIKEMNYMCMSGMLLCLDRKQRLTFILGEMFGADHGIGSEILGITKDNFRKRLSRARSDLFNFMNHKCGLVNKSNPCRCHKKVTYALNGKLIDNKNLLFNRKEFSNFKTEIQPSADRMMEVVEDKYATLFQNLPYKEDFDKKAFFADILEDIDFKDLLNLN